MTQLSELYDGDAALVDPTARSLRAVVTAPHPLHGVEYGDGVVLCGRTSCERCRDYRKARR